MPDYEGLRALFRGLAERVGVEYDGVFDWTVKEKVGDEDDANTSTGEVASPVGGGSGSVSGRGSGRGTGRVGGGSRRYCEACNARNRR